MTTAQIVPALVIPLILWRVYLRVRRNIGRQPWQPRRLLGAAIFFGVVTALIALASVRFPSALTALAGGLLLALPLGWLGLRLTRFDLSSEEKFYTPNTALGLAVTVLFVGRIVYRVVTVFGTDRATDMSPSTFQNPLTLLVFGLTAGYYITYYVGVYFRGRDGQSSTAAK